MVAIPTARLGAPPVRDSRVASPIWRASASICPGCRVKPHCAIVRAAVSAVGPRVPAGTFIAKYTAGSSVAAAMMAIRPTNDSISMPP